MQRPASNHPEQSGRFSGGSGIAFYGGGALGAAYDASLFVNDVVVNVVHQDVLTADAPSFAATRRAEGVELLAGRDNWFRPVTLATGPEGALYVVDMHRAVIEHPEWIPDAVEATLDVRAGDDKGPIYRIVPREGLPTVRPDLASADLEALVAALAHPNKWWRDTAQRLLVERGDPAAAPLAAELLRASDAAPARLHALWTLRGLSALEIEEIQDALADPAPGIRENALVLSEPRLRESEPLRRAVTALADDPDARVRMQAALTLGTVDASQSRAGLQAILGRDAGHRWTRYAALAGLGNDAPDVLRALFTRTTRLDTEAQTAGLLDAVRHLGAMATSADEGELPALVRLSDRPGLADPWRVAAAAGIDDLAARDQALERARERAVDTRLAVDERADEVAVLALGAYTQVGDTLFQLMDPQSPPTLQVAAARALASLDDPQRGAAALGRFRRHGAAVKGVVIDILLRNRPFHEPLISALESGDLSVGELNLDLEQRRRLLRRSSDDIQTRAAALFGDHEFSNR